MLIKSYAEVIQLKPPQQSQFVVQFVLPHIFGVKSFIVLGIYPRTEGQWSLAMMVTPDLCRRQCLLNML